MTRRRKPARPELGTGPAPAAKRHAEPATETVGPGADAATRGKATRTPEDVATRPHLEGSEQGPA